MTLNECKSDIEYIMLRLEESSKHGEKFLTTYLRAKQFNDDHLLLMIAIADDVIAERQLQAHIDYFQKGPDPDEFILGPEGYEPRVKRPVKDLYQIIRLLSKNLTLPQYKFDKINPRYLASPDKEEEFVIAETFMLQHRYFLKNGSWNTDLELKDLITFLNMLRVAGILKYSTEKDMDTYFSERYKMGSIGGLLRLNKLISYKKFGEFKFLVEKLGYKIEDLEKE
jgi:hypothetical protein